MHHRARHRSGLLSLAVGLVVALGLVPAAGGAEPVAARWVSQVSGFEIKGVYSLKVSPKKSDLMFACIFGGRSRNQHRGIYKTTDGGATWKMIKAGANNKTGAIDIQIDPSNPDVLYLAMWERYRTP